MIVELTEHSVERGRERMNLSRPVLQRTAQKAFEQGIHHDLATGKMKAWTQTHIKQNVNHVRIMGHYAFLFHDATLITILLVPKEVRPKVRHKQFQDSH